jgi:hypothetical protein
MRKASTRSSSLAQLGFLSACSLEATTSETAYRVLDRTSAYALGLTSW